MLRNNLLGLLALIMLAGAGCFGATNVDSPNEAALVDPGVIEEYVVEEENAVMTISKNTLTNEATLHGDVMLADHEEWVDFLGDQVAAAPMAVNLSCYMYQSLFFAPERLEQFMEEYGGTMANTGIQEVEAFLDGAEMVEFDLMFLDLEDGEQIAACMSTGASESEITYEAFREYDVESSLLGAIIGQPAF